MARYNADSHPKGAPSGAMTGSGALHGGAGTAQPTPLTDEKKRECTRRLLLSRMRILVKNGFFGLLLMHMKFALDITCPTAATDGTYIYFSPAFMDSLSDSELDFILMHEVLHVALQHCTRTDDRDSELFNIACDIVVNSNIMHACGDNASAITLQEYGESMHCTPNDKEGYLFTAEEVYAMLEKAVGNAGNAAGGSGLPNGTKNAGGSSGKGGKSPQTGAGKTRGSGKVGKGGNASAAGQQNGTNKAGQGTAGASGTPGWDDHSRWELADENGLLRDLWVKRLEDAAEAIRVRDPENSRGLLPRCAARLLDELRKPQTNWREVLNNFVEEDVLDYTFTPPDRRFADSPFFLPDYGDVPDEAVKDVLFMGDTSGSVSDAALNAAYSEIKGAIDQFGGRLRGWLGFFDAAIYEPKPFESVDDLKKIRPIGGGGTDFGIVFRYIREKMADTPPSTVVILTDGYAPFPPESAAGGIPVLWLINNKDVTPPWGKVARIEV